MGLVPSDCTRRSLSGISIPGTFAVRVLWKWFFRRHSESSIRYVSHGTHSETRQGGRASRIHSFQRIYLAWRGWPMSVGRRRRQREERVVSGTVRKYLPLPGHRIRFDQAWLVSPGIRLPTPRRGSEGDLTPGAGSGFSRSNQKSFGSRHTKSAAIDRNGVELRPSFQIPPAEAASACSSDSEQWVVIRGVSHLTSI